MSKSENARLTRKQRKKLAERVKTIEAQEAENMAELGPARTSQTRIAELVLAGCGGYDDGTPWLNPERTWEVDPDYWFPATDDVTEYTRLGLYAPVATFLNATYQVNIFDQVPGERGGWPPLWHLSIKRRDRAPIDENRWRILQRIKNELVDPQCEAVELYPAESRLIDTANQYHLWVLMNRTTTFPFGFQTRLVTDEPGGGAVQRGRESSDEDEANFTETIKTVEGRQGDDTAK